jgi:AraC-like DNA-binding protein
MNSVARRSTGSDQSVINGPLDSIELASERQVIDLEASLDLDFPRIRHSRSFAGRHQYKPVLASSMEMLAKNMMIEKMARRPSIQEVATACGLSRSHFTRAFKQTTGYSPHQWLTNARVERAKILLSSTKCTGRVIAAECGFSDHSHFTRVFAIRVGILPMEWRLNQLLRKEPDPQRNNPSSMDCEEVNNFGFTEPQVRGEL